MYNESLLDSCTNVPLKSVWILWIRWSLKHNFLIKYTVNNCNICYNVAHRYLFFPHDSQNCNDHGIKFSIQMLQEDNDFKVKLKMVQIFLRCFLQILEMASIDLPTNAYFSKWVTSGLIFASRTLHSLSTSWLSHHWKPVWRVEVNTALYSLTHQFISQYKPQPWGFGILNSEGFYLTNTSFPLRYCFDISLSANIDGSSWWEKFSVRIPAMYFFYDQF